MSFFTYNICSNFYLYKVCATYAKKDYVYDTPIMYYLTMTPNLRLKKEINIK